MIHVDENDPIGEVQLSFPYRNVQIKHGFDPKEEYELQDEMGRGKFGTVYRCLERQSKLQLAAKFIAVPKKEDRRSVEREIDIMRSLQHPRLLQMYDAFDNGKVMCLILELIEGGELFERVIDDDFILTEKSCVVFMRQICEGVDFIHKQKIIHLDMKPENVLCLTKTGNRIKIIDFGLARRFDPNKKLQVLFGTPEFVAPEVVNFDQISFGTDMWSVGVICYVLLSGLSPFMGSTDAETMANVTIGKYDFDDEAFDEISPNAIDFIKKLLVKDINERMSAEDCLRHEWLVRKKTSHPLCKMDITKDNLRQFVERWNEHPNSPYVFDSFIHHNNSTFSSSSIDRSISGSLQSLVGMSPSPCASLESCVCSPGTITPQENDTIRRSSDSSYVVRKTDQNDRFILADEIKKLTDRLLQLSTMNADLQTTVPVSIPRSAELERFTKHTNNIPWRRPKQNRLNANSRDVPLLPMYHSNLKTHSQSPDETKDILLKLLDQWDGPQMPNRPNPRHGSVSTEWNEHDSLGQRTISSLNNFFQSRTKSKCISTFQAKSS